MPGFDRLSRRAALGGLATATALPLLGAVPAFAEAPMLGAAKPEFYRFGLGAFEVTTLRDGAIQLDGPHPIFGEDQPVETVRALAEERFLPPDRMAIGFAPMLVNTGAELVLFDAGNGPERRPDAGNLVASLAAAGYTPDQVDIVVITHMHPDHIGGLMTEGAPTYPNARCVTAAPEFDFWSAQADAQLVQSNVMPLAERTTMIGDGDAAASGITAVAAFGHTPGHTAWHLESDGERLLLWADTSNHYVLSVQRPDWHVRFDMDKEAAAATRHRLFDMAATDRIPVTGYHMPFPAVGYVERTPNSFRWVQSSYQLDL